MPEFIRRQDIFKQKIPAFSLEGRTSVETTVGALCSILIIALTFAFGLLKLQHLVDRKNPLITRTRQDLSIDDTYDLNRDDFMVAFFFDGIYEEGIEFDPSRVKWVAQAARLREDGLQFESYEMHPCTQDELRKFYPPDSE